MEPSRFKLSPEEHLLFEKEGYLIVKNTVPVEMLTELTSTVDAIWNGYMQKNPDSTFLHLFDFIYQDEKFLPLITIDKILPKVIMLLSPNIYIYHCHLDINKPIIGNSKIANTIDWHRDSSIIEKDLKSQSTPMFSLKVGYWLSDLSSEGRGNLMVVPGSHKFNFIPTEEMMNREAIPILALPGDVIIFDRRLWHGRSQNVSNITRKVLFIGYAFRWIRSRDSIVQRKYVDPIHNQLLGSSNTIDYYTPNEFNTPLFKYIKRQMGD